MTQVVAQRGERAHDGGFELGDDGGSVAELPSWLREYAREGGSGPSTSLAVAAGNEEGGGIQYASVRLPMPLAINESYTLRVVQPSG